MEDAIRLPRYARGLRLVRIGVLLMLLQFALSIVVTFELLRASGLEDTVSAVEWLRYMQWMALGSAATMLAGAVLTVPDFRQSGMSLRSPILAIAGFGIVVATLWWSSHLLTAFLHLASSPERSLDELVKVSDDLDSLRWWIVVKDICYTVGLVSIVGSIRDTAIENEHFALQNAAITVGRLVAGLMTLDIAYQVLGKYLSVVLGLLSALIVMAFAIGVLVGWIYVHLRLVKFLGAAATLVDQPHQLPQARLVRTRGPVPEANPESTDEASAPIARPSKPAMRPSKPSVRAPSRPSAPLDIVRAELRASTQPVAVRAETAPGEDVDQPKFLRDD